MLTNPGLIFFDRSHACAKIEVTGEDRISLLHSILSQDIANMEENTWREGAFLSATSHVLTYFYILRLKDSVLLASPNGNAQAIIGLLEKFVITEDVRFESTPGKFFLFEVWGHDADIFLRNQFPDALAFSPEGANGPRRFAFSSIPPAQFSKSDFSEEKIREQLRIENGIVEYIHDFDEKIMLSETRLEKRAASETKGCYPGQEVVAKIETYGRLNRGFIRLELLNKTKLPEIGSKIFSAESGEEIGLLTSRTESFSGEKNYGIGWLKRGFFEKPIKVSVEAEPRVAAETTLFVN